MAKNIKKVTHDLLSLADAVTERGKIVAQLLHAIKQHARFDDEMTTHYFDQGLKALDKLAISADLIKTYLHELDNEADKSGISKK